MNHVAQAVLFITFACATTVGGGSYKVAPLYPLNQKELDFFVHVLAIAYAERLEYPRRT